MERADIKFTLDYEDMSAFFEDMEDDWMLEIPSYCAPQSANISPVNKVNRKPRRYPSEMIKQLRQERSELELQLQNLGEKYHFRESLKKKRSSYGLNWKMFAVHERIQANSSHQENARLKNLAITNARRIRRISRSIHRQHIGMMPKSLQADCRIKHLKDQAHVFRHLQRSLEFRRNGQLDAIIDHCNEQQLDQISCSHPWRTFILESVDIGVDFHEAVVLPFGAQFISGAGLC